MIKKEDIDTLNKFDNFCGDAVDETMCYYIRNNQDKNSCSFFRIEFYKPGFFYIQDFREGIGGGSNTKCVFKCSDIIKLINKDIEDEKIYNIIEEKLEDKFSNDEIKIIKYISYLYKTQHKTFDFIIKYFRENADNQMINQIHRDNSPLLIGR